MRAASPQDRTVESREFILTDHNGTRRVIVRLDPEGHFSLSFADSKGIPRAILAALGLGVNATGLAFYDKDQRLRANGAPYLRLSDRKGKLMWKAP